MSDTHAVPGAVDENLRLHLLEQLLDPLTIRRLEALQIQPGWRCLEVGAGEGSIARWLAAAVGPGGQVVATDIDPRLREEATLSQLVVKRHDILVDTVEPASYDLVHTRAVLAHLGDPLRAVQAMAHALRPGGLLLLEDFDWWAFGSVKAEAPDTRLFDEKMVVMAQSLKAYHIMNLYIGRNLYGFLEAVGLSAVAAEGIVNITPGGGISATFQRLTLQLAAPYLIAAGIWTEQDRETIERLFADPAFAYLGGIFFQAWGRRASELTDG